MEQRKIVLIGKTGDGKSSSGNTILGEKLFTPNSCTDKSVRRDGLVHGRKITVLDTPGFFDTDCDDKEIKSEIINQFLIECAPALHAFVMVLKVGRYTRHENEVVQQFLNTFKEEHVLKHTVILFTHGDQLEGQTIEDFVKANSKLQELVNKCGGRCHVIDNKYWNDCDSGNKSNKVQVKNLLDAIDKMVKENGCYTNELLQKVEEEIQEEMKKNEDKLPQEEKREKIVQNKFLVQAAGALTGVVVGPVMGVHVALSSVGVLFKAASPKKLLKAAKKFAGRAEVEPVVAGEAAVEAAVAEGAAVGGGAVVEAAVAEGAAVAGGAAVEAAVAGGAAVEAAVAGGAAVEAVIAGGAAVEAAVAGGAAVEAVIAGGAAVEAVVAGGAAVEAVIAGGAAVEAVVAGGAAVEAVIAGGAAVEAVVAGGAAAAGVGAGPVMAAGVLGAAALGGFVGGGVAGWEAAEDAESVYGAMTKAAAVNYENAKVMVEKVQAFFGLQKK